MRAVGILPPAQSETSAHAGQMASARQLHVAQISFFNDPLGRAPEELLAAWRTLVDVAESTSCAGIRTSVIQASEHTRSLEREGVTYHFLPFGRRSLPIDAHCALGRLIRDLEPDVFHVHGLGFPRQVRALAELAPRTPILLQDHANRPPRLWRRWEWRRCTSLVSAISFCSRDQAEPFTSAGLLHAGIGVHEVPESTSRFAPGDRGEARRALQMTGEPLLLWVGHLNENKDPLSVLAGVSLAARHLPGLRLYCCFGTAPLLRAVQRRIAEDYLLRGRVHLLGAVPHESIELMMRAADLFVLGSRRESTGYSLIEALASGLPPVVTDIPSFRALTGEGEVGRLWPCGNADALCEAILSVAARTGSAMRAAVRAHFDRELSIGALGRKLAAMYESMVRRNESRRPGGALAATPP
jgi:glycosyltransferase involved in cell wall biosynthesis